MPRTRSAPPGPWLRTSTSPRLRPLRAAHSSPPQAGCSRPQCHSHLSLLPALPFRRCRRDPRARGPRPRGVAPTPAGSGGGGRTPRADWVQTLSPPRPCPDRQAAIRSGTLPSDVVAGSAPLPPVLRGEGLAVTVLRSSFAKFAWCLYGSCRCSPRNLALNLCHLFPGTCSEHHAETSPPSLEPWCVCGGGLPSALGRKSRHSGYYLSSAPERRVGWGWERASPIFPLLNLSQKQSLEISGTPYSFWSLNLLPLSCLFRGLQPHVSLPSLPSTSL